MFGSERSGSSLFVKQPQSSRSLSGASKNSGAIDGELAEKSWRDLGIARELPEDTRKRSSMTSNRPSDNTLRGPSRRDSRREDPRREDYRRDSQPSLQSRSISSRERSSKDYTRSTPSRDAQGHRPNDLRGRSSRSPPPRERRRSYSPRSPLPRRRRSRSPKTLVPARDEKSVAENTAIITTNQVSDAQKSFTNMFKSYAKELSVLTSLQLRRTEADRLKEMRCLEFEKSSSLHANFPSTRDSQSNEMRKAKKCFDDLDREYRAQEARVGKVVEDMAAQVIPSSKGVDYVHVQELQARCDHLEATLSNTSDELSKTSKALNDTKIDAGDMRHRFHELETDLIQSQKELRDNKSYVDNYKNQFSEFERRFGESEMELSKRLTNITMKVQTLEDTALDSDKDTTTSASELSTVKKDLETLREKLQHLENKQSNENGIENRIRIIENVDFQGMQNNLENKTTQIETLMRQVQSGGSVEVRLDRLEAESNKTATQGSEVSSQQLQTLEERLDRLETDSARHNKNFVKINENTGTADAAHTDLEARVSELEQARPKEITPAPQTKPPSAVGDTTALEQQLLRYERDLKEMAKDCKNMNIRIDTIREFNPDTPLPNFMANLRAKNLELVQMVNKATNSTDDLRVRHIGLGVEAQEICMDLVQFRVEQEERDMLFSPKIDQVDQHQRELETLSAGIFELRRKQKEFHEQQTALQSRVNELNLERLNKRQSANASPTQQSSNAVFSPQLQHPAVHQQNHSPQFSQYANQSNGFQNGGTNGAVLYGSPYYDQVGAALEKKLSSHIDSHIESTTMAINNLESRMNNLSTGHIVKYMVEHLHNMFPDVRNAANEFQGIKGNINELHNKLVTLGDKINEVGRAANRTHDISLTVRDLEASRDELTDNYKILQQEQTFQRNYLHNLKPDKIQGLWQYQEDVKTRLSALTTQLNILVDIPNNILTLKESRDEVQRKVGDLAEKCSGLATSLEELSDGVSTDFVKLREDLSELKKEVNNTDPVGPDLGVNKLPGNAEIPAASSSRLSAAAEGVSRKRSIAATSNGDSAPASASKKKKKKVNSQLWVLHGSDESDKSEDSD